MVRDDQAVRAGPPRVRIDARLMAIVPLHALSVTAKVRLTDPENRRH